MEETEILRLLSDKRTRERGFDEIVDQYSEKLYWKIRSMVFSHEDANDILQNTFIKAWKNIDSFEGKSKLSTWIYRIAINETLDFLRHKKSVAAINTDGDMSVANRLMGDEYFDGDRAQAILQEAVSLLPEVQRAVFTMRYYDEMKYSEMSKVLSTSEGALKASYHIAVQKITKYVKSHDDFV